MILFSRHSGAGRNPVQLFNMQLGFVRYGDCFIRWIPACAGMTKF